MKRVIALALSILLFIPTVVFAEGQSVLERLHLNSDSGPVPGFFRRQIQANCGDFTVDGNTISGFTQGHTVNLRLDKVNHLVEYTIDGLRWTAFFDDKGQITEMMDPLNKRHDYSPLTPEQAKAAAIAHHDEFMDMLSSCGLPPVETKCLDTNQFSEEVKSCLPDYFGDEGYWENQLASGYDVSEFTNQYLADLAQCQAAKQACSDACNLNGMMDGALCAALINPFAVAACMAGSAVLWTRCTTTCSTSFPC